MPSPDTTRIAHQQVFARWFARAARNAVTQPYPADMTDSDTLRDRLDTIGFVLCVGLEGASGLDPHRLSPKGQPDIDIAAPGMHEAWANSTPPARGDYLATERDAFLTQVRKARDAHATQPDTPGNRVNDGRALLVDICRIIEDGYTLTPDDSPDVDIAPGLTGAVVAAWTSGYQR